MARPEQFREMVRRFDAAIYGIRDAGVPGISEMARKGAAAIEGKQLPTVVGNGSIHNPSTVDFAVVGSRFGQVYSLQPVLALNPDRLLSASPAEIQQDIVRSLAIARRFPTYGYENRLVDVYSEALLTEESWLASREGYTPTQQTPEEHQARIRELLGDAKYYTDTGFADWQQAIDKLKERDASLVSRLDALRNDKTTFLMYRERYAGMNYEVGVKTMGEEAFLQREDRPEISAMLYIGYAIMPANPRDN